MVKITKKSLSEIIDLAHREFNKALPHNLDTKEVQAYLFIKAIKSFLVKNGVDVLSIDQKDFFNNCYEIFDSNDLAILPDNKEE